MAGAVIQQLASISSEVQSDSGQRMQQVALRRRGIEWAQSAADLHAEWWACVGAGGQRRVPKRQVLVRDLDTFGLTRELNRCRNPRSEDNPHFGGKTAERFDAALGPAGTTGLLANRWQLFIEEALPPRNQIRLYPIAVGYGLLDREARRMCQPAPLDRRASFTQRWLLSESRLVGKARQDRDRGDLKTYLHLADLLRPLEELAAATSAVDPIL